MGMVTARLSRPIASPILRTRPATAPVFTSPWLRTYSKGPLDQSPSSEQNKQTKNDADAPTSESSAKPDPVQESKEHDLRNADGKTPEGSKESENIPFDKLPDLTQGIPSTLFEELGGKKEKGSQALEEVDESQSSGGSGGRDRAEYVSTTERNRKWWTRFMLIASAAGSTFGILYMGRNWDEIEAERYPDIANGPAPDLWWQRAKTRMTASVAYYQEPSFEKLLPDPDPAFERPYTLCISLDDLLVHSEWTRDHGWRVAKRPGFDYFIRYLGQYYELVLFTTVPYATAEPIMRKLDPFHLILPLFREATKYENGEIVKVSFPCQCWRIELTKLGSFLSQPRPVQGDHPRH